MPPRTLGSFAHALAASADLDACVVALGEALAEVDRSARVALIRYDARRDMLRELSIAVNGRVERAGVDTAFDHLADRMATIVRAGGQFADLGDNSDEYSALIGIAQLNEEGLLALRGIHTEGSLAAVLALYEPKRFFGTRVMERFGPYAALFDLAFARFAERDAREEAVRTLEDVTQRVHGDYVRNLKELEGQLTEARTSKARSGGAGGDPQRLLWLETEAARAQEDARRAQRQSQALEQQVTAAVSQLEQAHVELHRRSENLRQKIRTLYLIERVLFLDASTADPRQLADGLLALVGDDTQAQRCSLMLRVPDTNQLYIAAAKGLAPAIQDGTRVQIGRGVAGKVAESRQPLLVTDVTQAASHPLLKDQYFTTGSFISFPLVYHDQLVGVVNLTNRARAGVFVEEDVERVRLLGLVISLVASHAQLAERLFVAIGVR
ncbi:MAG: GAF domain-containing protein [Gemmatimonadota bacterium]|nr:GAF domain-containing protein [Gemmatimonadota bacterium]